MTESLIVAGHKFRSHSVGRTIQAHLFAFSGQINLNYSPKVANSLKFMTCNNKALVIR